MGRALDSKRQQLAEQILHQISPEAKQACLGDLRRFMHQQGFSENDSRLPTLLGELCDQADNTLLDASCIRRQLGNDLTLLERIFTGALIIPEFSGFCRGVEQIYDQVMTLAAGDVANYIPELARVDPGQFAVSVCTIDGQCFDLGDYNKLFSIQSICKTINYCLALEACGERKVHHHIGREPSGHGFNELRLNKQNLPHNPMINAGAIMACALIEACVATDDPLDHILSQWQALADMEKPSVNQAVYQSEKNTADRNFALAYFMNEKNIFPKQTQVTQVLDFYFQCCAIQANTQYLARVAASLANSGTCPFNEQKIFADSTVKHCLSLMSSCGLYDYSGEFAFSVGVPGKSSVSGALMLVIPNVMGLAIWSPRLDSLGNSVRGIAFAKQLVARYNFHTYDNLMSHSGKYDPRKRRRENIPAQIAALCWAAYYGDLGEIKRLLTHHPYLLNKTDYDQRSALHIAVSEGQLAAVRYLLKRGADTSLRDRWQRNALMIAEQQQQHEIVALLESWHSP